MLRNLTTGEAAVPDTATSSAGRVARLSAGIVAHNEAANLARSVRSLLEQPLPRGVAWSDVTIVASGCTDATDDVARALAASDPRISVLLEPERGGKARALRQVFRRARGDALVLLNADARAGKGAVSALLEEAQHAPAGRPFAVMGRPIPHPVGGGRRWSGLVRTLWELHHEYHAHLATVGGGAHLSDELLLLSLPTPFDLPDGTVNDGSYIGVWMARHGGSLRYAARAGVDIEAPATIRDHVSQRRRIHVGNLEVAAELGLAPSTLVGAAAREPGAFVRIVGRRLTERGVRVVSLGALDALAALLARWDRLPPARSYARWPRIERPSLAGGGGPGGAYGIDPADERLDRFLTIAGEFEIGHPVAELLSLLPAEGPTTEEELARWVAARPSVAGLERGELVDVRRPPRENDERRARAAAYLDHARDVVRRRWAPLLGWVRTVGVSGSTAFGAPDAGDDLDLFVVARRGALWAFLAGALVLGRLERRRHPGTVAPPLCLNHVLDERTASEEFARPQGLLFAREALAVRPVWGESFYRGLLGRARWIEALLPRRYPAEARYELPDRDRPVPVGIRLLNAAVFPLLAAYLQLVGLFRNRQFQRRGHAERMFRTVTTPSRQSLASERFERIRQLYEGAPVPDPTGTGSGRPDRARAVRAGVGDAGSVGSVGSRAAR
jgi:hypothetical protein